MTLIHDIMTLEEVANYLKLKPQTIYTWAQEKKFRPPSWARNGGLKSQLSMNGLSGISMKNSMMSSKAGK